ncbi:MAG: hypothetical protein AB8B93_18100 [Pseudomonadales bacterium]
MSTPTEPVRIAMWSGPRNISTAMMRSFENRADCVVVDEPFYACYLAHSGVVHPMQEAVLASQPRQWSAVTAALREPLPAGVTLQYQKHMTHHMLEDLDAAWVQEVQHAFLIRNPADMVASYVNKRGSVTVDDLGLPRQVALYQSIQAATGQRPPVVEARDVLQDPEPALRQLCGALGIAFAPEMLAWPAGLRSSDGVWASHWYNAVETSTGFGAYSSHSEKLPSEYQRVVDACQPYYEFFQAQKSV